MFKWFKFLVLLALAVVSTFAAHIRGVEDKNTLLVAEGRIVGGSGVSINSYPWQVSVQRNGVHACGGAIYNNHIIITAAHCLQIVTPAELRIRAGSNNWNADGILMEVEAFKNHENYNPITMANDIAVVRLRNALSYSAAIRYVNVAYSTPSNGVAAIISGWGSTAFWSNSNVNELQAAEVNIISRPTCSSSAYDYGSRIETGMLCAAGSNKDACRGDAGSPLVIDKQLVGIASWGEGCAFVNYPGVYVDVAMYRNWIVNSAYSV